jgi:hypothetical protein
MKEIPSYVKWSKSGLLDDCTKYGLPCSGTKADLINQLYPHVIEKRIASYKKRRARYLSQDPNGAVLLDEIRQLEEAMKKAAGEQEQANTEYLEKRLAEVAKTCEKKKQSASAFREGEIASITRHVRAGHERQVARTPSSSRVTKVRLRTCITEPQS